MRKAPIVPLFALQLGLLIAGCGYGTVPAPADEPAADTSEEPAGGTCSGAGPQSPRDIDQSAGDNPVTFAAAPPFTAMRLCDVHFHKFAEHKAAGYSTPIERGGFAGFACEGHDPRPAGEEAGSGGGCEGVAAGDTVEVHWVFTTCEVEPAPGLGSCFSSLCANPQLRVEAQVFYLTGEEEAGLDFAAFAVESGGTLPDPEGSLEYSGSTTGPSFSNEECSQFQVTWNVRPTCSPLRLTSLDAWCDDNVFDEDHAHGARELVTPLKLLSRID